MKVQKVYRASEYQQKNPQKKEMQTFRDPMKLPILSIKAQKQNLKTTCTNVEDAWQCFTTWHLAVQSWTEFINKK